MKFLKESFKAWIEQQAAGVDKLVVVGEVECPGDGWAVSLSRAAPQGLNPNILLLQVKAEPPAERGPGPRARVPVRYVEVPPRTSYTDAAICGAQSAPVAVPVAREPASPADRALATQSANRYMTGPSWSRHVPRRHRQRGP